MSAPLAGTVANASNAPLPATVPVPDTHAAPSPQLGEAPLLAERSLSHVRLPGASNLSGNSTGSFSLDPTQRERVRSFFNSVYQASEQVAMGWTGVVGTGSDAPGTLSAAYLDATLRRVNWFRAMAGVPADMTFSGSYNSKCQQAALMMSANKALSTSPPSSWKDYTAGGAEAAGKSLLAQGMNGAAAVTEYMADSFSGGAAVSHRRWLLYPQTRVMGNGDIPVSGSYPASNVLWINDGTYGSQRPATRDDFVAWPPRGYVPHQLVFSRWSFSYPGATFTNATVGMQCGGSTVALTRETPSSGYGENTLVWVPGGTTLNAPAADRSCSVTIDNVTVSGSSRSFSYEVTIFDPRTTGPDYVAPLVSGSATPAVGLANPYAINPVPDSSGYEWRFATLAPFTLTLGAESGLAGMTADIPSGYNPIATDIKAAGSASYHLCNPGARTQSLTMERVLLPGSSAKLSFKSRLGWAMSDQIAQVLVSVDEGGTWVPVYNQAGAGQNSCETSFSLRSADLSPYAGRPIRVRFALQFSSGSYYPQTVSGVGWYLDDISFSGVSEAGGITHSSDIATPGFSFVPPASGEYLLQARARMFGDYPLEWGPPTRVTARQPLQVSCSLKGDGGGSVTSDPVGISCITGVCSAPFAVGAQVRLMATPDVNTLFGGWSGGCTGTGDCLLSLAADTPVSAFFNHVPALRIFGGSVTGHETLAGAFQAASSGDRILARARTLSGQTVLSGAKRLILDGGYDILFATVTGQTVLEGGLSIAGGSLEVSGVVIR